MIPTGCHLPRSRPCRLADTPEHESDTLTGHACRSSRAPLASPGATRASDDFHGNQDGTPASRLGWLQASHQLVPDDGDSRQDADGGLAAELLDVGFTESAFFEAIDRHHPIGRMHQPDSIIGIHALGHGGSSGAAQDTQPARRFRSTKYRETPSARCKKEGRAIAGSPVFHRSSIEEIICDPSKT